MRPSVAAFAAVAGMSQHRGTGAPKEEEQVPRTAQEVFQHHAEALGAEDIDAIVSDYADDAIFMTPEGVLRGKGWGAPGVREADLGAAGRAVRASDAAL